MTKPPPKADTQGAAEMGNFVKAKYLAMVIAFVLLSGISYADSIDQVYAVNGSLTIVGKNVCGGLCVETLNFSFDLHWIWDGIPRDAGFYSPDWIDGTMNVTSTGPLSGFYAVHAGLDITNDNYLPWLDTPCIPFCGTGGDPYDEIDIGLHFRTATQGITPITFSEIYTCETATCMADFGRPAIDGTAEAVMTPITVPEESELGMLGITALGILAAMGTIPPKETGRFGPQK